jgi:hypothetical protein
LLHWRAGLLRETRDELCGVLRMSWLLQSSMLSLTTLEQADDSAAQF